jgi:hypothetical protein
MRNVEDVDRMLDSQGTNRPRFPKSRRLAFCPRCERVTIQVYWIHRGGWVCDDDGDGCAQRVMGQQEYDALCEAVENITAQDIWGR